MSEKKMILSNGPLTAVLIQIKFSTIVQIAKYIPDIQDSLRKKYPLYDVLQGENIQSGPHGEIEKQEFTQWVFSSNDYSRNIIVDNEKITYQVLEYHEYDYGSFIHEFLRIVGSFDSIVDMSSLTRFGLRYIHSIPEEDGLSWKDVLTEDFHGMTFPDKVSWFDNALMAFSTQRGVNLKSIGMVSNFRLKITQNSNGPKYPQDIVTFPLGDMEFFKNRPQVTFVDIDHYILFKAAEKEKTIGRLEQIFNELHTVIEEVFFNSLITAKAKKLWK